MTKDEGRLAIAKLLAPNWVASSEGAKLIFLEGAERILTKQSPIPDWGGKTSIYREVKAIRDSVNYGE